MKKQTPENFTLGFVTSSSPFGAVPVTDADQGKAEPPVLGDEAVTSVQLADEHPLKVRKVKFMTPDGPIVPPRVAVPHDTVLIDEPEECVTVKFEAVPTDR